MNKVFLIGRLVAAPEVRQTPSQTPFCNFKIAVDRRYKNEYGNRETDFIACTAWRQSATFLGSYCQKGNRVAVAGSIQTRKYDNDQGVPVYVTEVIVDEVELLESKSAQQAAPAPAPMAPAQPPRPTVVNVAPQLPKPDPVTLQEMEQFGQLPFEL